MAARVLRVAPDLILPVDVVTETLWWLGKRGSGKTHNCSVFVEELLKAKAQVVIIDPMSAWYGLRSSADGTGPGLPIAIFGGPHGDIPLEPSAGAYMADLAMGERVSMIFDVKRWSKADRRRFVTPFLQRLLAENETAMHVVIEEAPLFAPQRPLPGDLEMLGACEELVKLGRGSGIGVSLVSQRSATLNKEVSTQTEVIVAHRTPSPQDRKAVRDWFEVHDPERVSAAMDRLPHLPTGTAIVSSTDFLGKFVEVAFRRRETFDSSATPKVGQAVREARTFADIDLAAIKDQMAETIERAKAADPKELRKRVGELERELAAANDRLEVPEIEVVQEMVPFVPVEVVNRLKDLREALATIGSAVTTVIGEAMEVGAPLPPTSPSPRPREPVPARPAPRPSPRPSAVDRGPRQLAPSDLPQGERRILTAIAQYEQGVTREQLTVLTGYKRSSRDTYLQRLRSRDLIVMTGGTIVATDVGVEALGGDFEPLPTGAALREHWLRELPEGERRILAELVAVWPEGMHRDDLADRTGYKRSSRDTYLQRLRSRQLVTTDGEPRAADALFSG